MMEETQGHTHWSNESILVEGGAFLSRGEILQALPLARLDPKARGGILIVERKLQGGLGIPVSRGLGLEAAGALVEWLRRCCLLMAVHQILLIAGGEHGDDDARSCG
jgi:hypothetical protein